MSNEVVGVCRVIMITLIRSHLKGGFHNPLILPHSYLELALPV
jgi:hypothetical protein